MREFKSKRSSYIKVMLVLSVLLPVVILFISAYKLLEKPLAIAFTLLPACFFAWIYLGTKYIIDDTHLYYQSALIKGKIDIRCIREIVKGKTAWSGIRPATAFNGLVVKFNSYDEIYISPEEEIQFIEMLRQINGNIKVTLSGKSILNA